MNKHFVLRKRALLLSSMAFVALVLASGVALAEVIECLGTTSCFGTNSADTMSGTRADNQMFGGAGKDAMAGKGGADYIRGDQGADTIDGNGAGDQFLWGGGFDVGGNYDDGAADVVYGGSGADTIVGGFAKGGGDSLYGGRGDDTINSAQKDSGTGAAITGEVIDCGAGTDTVFYDKGKDEVKNCEIKNHGTSTSGRMALRAMNDDDLSGNGVPLPSPIGSEGARAPR